ncbi:hypothetical protein OAO01_01475 [Oligoflexia bacterium]|nr:hypothetical protein [Oligoflexia bacterium]
MRALTLVILFVICFTACSSTREWAGAQYDRVVQGSNLPTLRHTRDRALQEIAVEEEAYARLEGTGSIPEGSKERVKAVTIRAHTFYQEIGPVIDGYFQYNNGILTEITDDKTAPGERNELTKELEVVRGDLKDLLLALVEVNDSVATAKELADEAAYSWKLRLPAMQHAPDNLFEARNITDIEGFNW